MIVIPDAALPYMLLQRTDYLILPKNRLLYGAVSRVSKRPPVMTAVSLESRLRRRAIRRQFNTDMQQEYTDIRAWLPAHVEAILDVGCGLGGIDVLLFEHYERASGLRFYLLDRTQTDSDITYGYKSRADYYNSLDLTRETLVGNGLPVESLKIIEARDDAGIDITEKVDLVISLISWGFHYPVATYLDRAHDLLKPEGRLILDVRKGTDGMDQVEARFGNARVVSEAKKKHRVVATRA
ncbi:MAG: class I SAM-dependent methyltransferase [Armatimonadetes bacterium]|nr:class I SAM-dependent methyltransferase [Armatimonadota bacterium]